LTVGVVWLPEEAIVRAGTDGFATRLAVGHGDQVAIDDVLFQSEEPELRAHIVSLRSRVAELEAQLASERFVDRVQAAVTGFELSRARQELENEERRVARLTVRSKASGRFSIVKPRDLPGRFLKEGQVVAYILPTDPRVVRVAVLQEDIDLVRQRLKSVSVRLAESIGQTMEARVIREVPAGRDELPSRALSTSGGGALPADPRDNSGTKTLQRVFQFDLELAASSILPVAFGGRAYVRFEHHWEPLGQQLWRRLRQLFLARLQY
jgi:putative peptide zinc metalloprotease protein